MTHRPADKVAIIAVHGVGQQQPGETAQQISDMLGRVGLQSGSPFHFESFTESKLTIPVEHVWPLEKPGTVFTPDVGFSADAITKLDASDDLLRYQTTSFHSTVTSGGKSSNVSVFELYWNDLSHAPSSFAKFFAEMYQVFFHLASIGRKTVRFAADTSVLAGKSGRWLRFVRWCHELMQLLLPTSIPILNLFLLASALPIAVLAIPSSLHSPFAFALAFFGTALWLSLRLVRTRLGVWGIALSIMAAFAVSVVVYTWRENATALLMIAILAFGFRMAVLGSRALLTRYRPTLARNGPLAAFAITFLLLCYGMPWSILTTSARWDDAVLTAAAFSVYGNFGLLQRVWAAMFILSLPIIFSPLIQRFCRCAENEPIIRALQTGRLGILLSANLFFLTTSILWAVLLDLASPILLSVVHINIEMPLDLMHLAITKPIYSNSIYDVSYLLYDLTVGKGANAYLALLLAALLIVIVGVFPSAMSEGKLPPDPTIKHVRGMAGWLNGAFASFKLAERLLIIAWFMLAVGYVTQLPCSICDSTWVPYLGLMLAGSVPALLLGRRMLPRGLGQVLDIVLDVSNWLKERPFGINPRGRVLVRYLSLLKYLSASGYKKIIVVAHSQGTVVTADCLRLLEQSKNIRSSVFGNSLPTIEFVTAGSPLRQLYRERFPHQYGWAVSKTGGPDISNFAGVQHWINNYRSGDYVGRTLWNEPDPDKMNPVTAPYPATPVPQNDDICVGAGAHLHYFDGSTVVVGTVVAKLIL